MADKHEPSLIGYDPLAWLREPGVAKSSEPSEVLAIPEPKQPVLAEADADGVADSATMSMAHATRIALEAVQSIQNVCNLYERLLTALADAEAIEIDASAVSMVDTATLQLLLVLKRTALDAGKQVSFDFPSDRFVEAARLLGVAELLEVDQAYAGFF
ncbi:STAS domain-containing protein [Methylomonas sp. MED-D]|uniref:STAS domain-containing protein n=1 Tax=unclassified Methylomonas TaxID=2608980 RepID=UPI0028A57FF3|nr:STAS domain-containing protein [Methylomonas sp. MV1]MDT4331027.1 STAS domain-containing protein [Methylomonas sp. MV1]